MSCADIRRCVKDRDRLTLGLVHKQIADGVCLLADGANVNVDQVVLRLSNQVRIQGQTGYVSEMGSRAPLLTTNAMLLSAASISGSVMPLASDKIANYVAQLGLVSLPEAPVCNRVMGCVQVTVTFQF